MSSDQGGTAANGTLEAYSDIDPWLVCDTAYIDQAIEAAIRLQGVDNVDYLFVMPHSHSLNRRCIYHLQGAGRI